MTDKGLTNHEREFRRLWKLVSSSEREIDRMRREMDEMDAEAECTHRGEAAVETEEPVEITPEGPGADYPDPHNCFGSLTPRPKLTREMLPPQIVEFVYDEAERQGCDVAGPAMSALSV